jgi:anti-anti-sigma factor
MAQFESSLVSTLRRAPPPIGGRDGPGVVRLQGEYDVGTVAALSAILSRAIALDDADLVLDVSGVSFLDAATVGVIVRARLFLRNRSRGLLLRCPSRCVRRILDICDLTSLIEVGPEVGGATGQVGALGSWVAVPSAARLGHALAPASVGEVSGDDTPGGVDDIDRGVLASLGARPAGTLCGHGSSGPGGT